MPTPDAKTQRLAPIAGPTALSANATRDIAAALTTSPADTFRCLRALPEDQKHPLAHLRTALPRLPPAAGRAERAGLRRHRRHGRAGAQGGRHNGALDRPYRLQRILDNDATLVTPPDMLAELREDNKQLTAAMRETHWLCDEHGDVATASLLENWIDEAEQRVWFLFEATRSAESSGRAWIRSGRGPARIEHAFDSVLAIRHSHPPWADDALGRERRCGDGRRFACDAERGQQS
jgi:starvation-inducible DNA-binding protein